MISNTRRHMYFVFFFSNNINLISRTNTTANFTLYIIIILAAAAIYLHSRFLYISSECLIRLLDIFTHTHRRDIIVLSRDVCVSLPAQHSTAQQTKVYIYTNRERDQDRSSLSSPFFLCVSVVLFLKRVFVG
jgi:hypothetical protein